MENNINLKSDSPITETLQSVDLDNSQLVSSTVTTATNGVNSLSSSNSELASFTNLTTSLIDSLHLSMSYDKSESKLSDLSQLKNRLEIFKECFACLVNIKENEKIWIDNDGMCIDESPYYYVFIIQSVNRYINNQGRENLFKFFDVKFTEYVRFLDNIKEKIYENSDNKLFKKLIQDNIKLIDELIPGLHTVKITYHDYDRLANKISSIILTFIDFKDMIERQCNIK